MIDCNLTEENKKRIVDEMITQAQKKTIQRFISTSPDLDHIKGIQYINQKMGIENFYVVKNKAIKNDENGDFVKYCELRDSTKAFYISRGVSRKWMNRSDEERDSSGISILWPIESNPHYITALEKAEKGESPNNISPIFIYSIEESAKVLWMGDLETNFMDLIVDDIELPEAHILIAPHHGRDSGKVPKKFLEQIKPKVIIIGEAPSDHLNYYQGYNTITQNSAWDITMEIDDKKVHFYCSNSAYRVGFLKNEGIGNILGYYLGTLNI
jgi:beta-lactamase superfamily II metal-dependent hydrolase